MTARQEYQELRRLAEGATRGPWTALVTGSEGSSILPPQGTHPRRIARVTDGDFGVFQTNAAYIAAANPATVLRLLDALDTAEERLGALADAAEDYLPRALHDWRCEYRTKKAGWTPGNPPVIVCECGRTELDAAITAARSLLEDRPLLGEGQ